MSASDDWHKLPLNTWRASVCTDPAAWCPWWCGGSCPARPWPHRTSPPPGRAACFACPSPCGSPGPAVFGLYTAEGWGGGRWTHTAHTVRSLATTNTTTTCVSLGGYLLGVAVAEVLLLKVRQLQQRRLGLLQALHDHLRQFHAVLDGGQTWGVKTCETRECRWELKPRNKGIEGKEVWHPAGTDLLDWWPSWWADSPRWSSPAEELDSSSPRTSDLERKNKRRVQLWDGCLAVQRRTGC